LRPSGATKCGFVVRGIEVAYDPTAQRLTCLDKSAPLSPVEGAIRLELLVDRTSIEIFAHEGEVYMPMGIIPPATDKSIRVLAEGVPVKIESLEIYPLKPAWP
ncbi:MAG TPA: GH32 C-terminal domain-containing protein, partial [Sedimentisphaerales bacterium]|nr:GH32 C-terminal domain-containing protein [Sedimentisphaerales bacterium]